MTLDARPVGSNWAGNHRDCARTMAHPDLIWHLRRLVRAEPRVRASGTRQSVKTVADTTGVVVSTASLPSVVDTAEDRKSVCVSATLTYGILVEQLQRAGLALGNLGSLPHISVAGAVATETRGSRNGGLGEPDRTCQLRPAGGRRW